MSQKRDVLMRPYFAPIGTGTSGTHDEGRDVKQITKTVGLDKRGSAESGPRKVREMTGYHLEDAGKALGKPRGFGRRNVGARTPCIELLCFSCSVIVFVPQVWLSSYKCDVVCMLFMLLADTRYYPGNC